LTRPAFGAPRGSAADLNDKLNKPIIDDMSALTPNCAYLPGGCRGRHTHYRYIYTYVMDLTSNGTGRINDQDGQFDCGCIA
jgi:hypothetical protein